jgi:hypothetical protein
MKSKILFTILAATIMLSLFAGLNNTQAQGYGSMALNPVEKVYDPHYGTQGDFFLWELDIDTSVQVSAWEAYLWWNPAVLRISVEKPVVWGTFMSGAPVGGVAQPVGAGAIKLGQYFTEEHTVTGSGVLAYLNFTFVLPGATTVEFGYALVFDNDLNTYELTGVDGRIKSNRPYPAFTWSTADGRNPLPPHTIKDGGDSIVHYDEVTFNASASFDVSNLVWDGTAWVPDAGYPDIVYYRWEFGDGGVVEGSDKVTVTHVYPGYNKDGWLVNLTVWDSEGDYWSTTWRYGGPDPANTVPMWRDVAVVDIWPSLPPYHLWDEEGVDWYAWWWFDTVDYWIPNINDAYWDYHLPDSFCDDFGIPHNTTVREFGAPLWILVTACNYGSVDERVTIKLYAAYMNQKLDFLAGPVWIPKMDQNVYLIDTFTTTLKAGRGSGWSLITLWMPPKDGFYVFFATIEPASGAVVEDQDPTNNYFVMPATFTTTAAWDKTTLTLVKEPIFAKYLADICATGKIGAKDLGVLVNRQIYGKFWYNP